MTQQIINLGTADKGNGDVLRTAFGKVNANFAELYNQIATSVVVGATAPTGPEEGALWWNSESGRMYVYYGSAWVDASPVDGAGISSTNELVNGGNTVSLGSDGKLTLPNGVKITPIAFAGIDLEVGTKIWNFGTDGTLTLPNSATISAVDIGIRFISSSNGPGGVAVQENSLTVGIANPTVIAALVANPGSHYIDFNSEVAGATIASISGPQAGTNIYTLTGTWPANATGFPITVTSIDWNPDVTKVGSDSGVIIETVSGSWTFGEDGDLVLPAGGTIRDAVTGDDLLVDLGDWAFRNDLMYSLNGGVIENSDLTHGATAALTIPTNGSDSPIVLTNAYGNVALVSGANPGALKTWTFGVDGTLTLPAGGDIVDSNGGIEINTPSEGIPSGISSIGSTTSFWDLNPLSNLATTGGSGTGLTVTVTQTEGVAIAIAIVNPGTGYTDNDLITVTSGGANAMFYIDAIGNNSWNFGTDGALTFPNGTLKITDSVISNLVVVGDLSTGSQIQVGSGVAADTGIIISNSVTNSLGEGGPALESGSLVNVNGSSAYMALKTVNSLGGGPALTGEEMVEVSSSGVRIGVRVTNDLGDGSPPLIAFQGWTFDNGELSLPIGTVISETPSEHGLYRTKYSGTFVLDPTWFAANAGNIVNSDSFPEGVLQNYDEVTGAFSFQYFGYFVPPTSANYTFRAHADETFVFWIGAKALSGYTYANKDMYGNYNGTFPEQQTQSFTIALTAGQFYPIRIQWANSGGVGQLDVFTWGNDAGQAATADFTGRVFRENTGTAKISANDNKSIILSTDNATDNNWTFAADGTTTLPGAITRVVAGTVAKTGATIPTTTGPINNFDFSPLDGSGGLVDGTNIGPLTVGTVTFFAVVENGLPYVSYIATQPILTIGDTIGTIDSGDLGGTPGTTFTITVSNVVQETPTAIDLTKSVNKLTNGNYTLANGVEGQIMYLVRQTGATAATVTVANARLDGFAQTNIPFTPFTDGTNPTNMATLIFTDSAWQNMGGYWNLT